MQDNLLLTIVVPAYNMEKYLHRCLDSLIADSVMNRVQVLIVNDGSRDKTSEIAHEYEVKYPNYIHVVDKQNGNYGSCMNVGLSLAQGKYFRSLDADDWFEKSNYVKFVEELEKTDADMLLGERYVFYEDTNQMRHVGFSSDVTIFNEDLTMSKSVCAFQSFYHLSMVWGLTYKTSIVRESGLKWDEGVFYTDNEFDFWPLKLVKTIRFIPIPVYVYLFGREGQSVDPMVKKRNMKSYQIVANSMIDEFLRDRNPMSSVYEMQMLFISRMIGPFFYQLLESNDYDKTAINEMIHKVLRDPILYKTITDKVNYRGMHYIDAYHTNKIRFYCIKMHYWLETIRYKLVTNKNVRKFFMK
jgi:glycosyltransferase involved in cell wall biosynthesis